MRVALDAEDTGFHAPEKFLAKPGFAGLIPSVGLRDIKAASGV